MPRVVPSLVAVLTFLSAVRPEARQATKPTAHPDTYATAFNTTLTVPAPGVLANDVVNGPGGLTAVLMTQGPGQLVFRADGGFTYTPQPGFTGPEIFLYRAVSAAGQGNTATVTINVAPPVGGLVPLAVDDVYDVGANGTLHVEAPDVWVNDDARSPFGAGLEVLTRPAHGFLESVGVSYGLTYTPTPGFSGVDTFTYRLRNPSGWSAPATVTLRVAPAGAPVAPADFRVVERRGDAVTFAWTPPSSGAPVTAFRLVGGTTPGSVMGLLPLGLTPRATVSLPAGTLYVRLRSMAGAAASTASHEVRLQVHQPVAPAPPENLLGGVTGNRIELAWLRGLTGGATSNVVLDVTGAATGSLPIGDVDTFALDGVPDGSYTIAVRQVGPGGSSTPSRPVTLTVPTLCSDSAHQVPGPPRRVQAYAHGRFLGVQWDPPVAGPAPTSYEIQLLNPFPATVPVPGFAVSAPVAPGTYTLAVRSLRPCGASHASPAQTIVVR